MKKCKVYQFGVQIQYVRKNEEGAQPTIMVINPNGLVIGVVSDFNTVADILNDWVADFEEKSVVNSDN